MGHGQLWGGARARAVVVVHESGRGMTVGRVIARGLHSHGLHAFMLHLPGYGARRVEGMATIDRALPALQQARKEKDGDVKVAVGHALKAVEGK